MAFCDRIKQQFGVEAEAMLAALDEAPKTCVRLNTHKVQVHFEASIPVPWNTEGLRLTDRPVFTLDPLFHAGCYYPQESSSMFLQWIFRQLISGLNGMTVLDLCAAPGGKSLILADSIGTNGILISNEVIRSRAAVLKEVVTKWGQTNTIITHAAPADFGRLQGWFDCIVVDAPCSGEGMFRKDPRARSEWNDQSPLLCSARQRDILRDVLPALKQNGILIYSTCTFAPQENEDVIEALVESGEFESVPFEVPSEWPVDIIRNNGVNAFRFLPHKTDGEGFFIAVLRKLTPQNSRRSLSKPVFKTVAKANMDTFLKRGIRTETLCLGPDDEYYASPLALETLNALAEEVFVLMAGVHIGRLMHGEIIPAHALALAKGIPTSHPSIALSYNQAMAYLRGENPNVQGDSGWHTVTYNGAPLGWIKIIGQRINNYYPKEWRVRMK